MAARLYFYEGLQFRNPDQQVIRIILGLYMIPIILAD